MTDVDGAIEKSDRWLKKTGTSESRLGLLSAANAGAVERIRSGTAQVSTLCAVLEYVADHLRRTT
jgi:hypothetical protein